MYQNEWFQDRQAIKNPPAEAVRDCTGSGPADSAVAYWVAELSFDGPSWLIREHLSGYGAWYSADLCDHKDNLMRLFWVWYCDIAEEVGRDNITDESIADTCPVYLMR